MIAITEWPILFNGAMVNAIRAGRKVQTRRVIKPSRRYPIDFVGGGGRDGEDWNDPGCWGFESVNADWWLLQARDRSECQIPCPYGVPGDRLWVRESVLPVGRHPDPGPCAPFGYFYRADSFDHEWADMARAAGERWKPSIHMPRVACRLVLEVVSVRVERVASISGEDILDEGYWMREDPSVCGIDWFRDLWDSINGPRGFGWDVNPWVWVVEFRVVKGGRS